MTRSRGLLRARPGRRGRGPEAPGVGGVGPLPGPAAASAAAAVAAAARRAEEGAAGRRGRAPPRPCSHLADQLLPEGGAPPVGLLPRKRPCRRPAATARAPRRRRRRLGRGARPNLEAVGGARPRRKRSGDCGKRARARWWEMESRAPHGPPRAGSPGSARGPAARRSRDAIRADALETLFIKDFSTCSALPAAASQEPHTLVLSVRLLEFHFPPMALRFLGLGNVRSPNHTAHFSAQAVPSGPTALSVESVVQMLTKGTRPCRGAEAGGAGAGGNGPGVKPEDSLRRLKSLPD